MPPSPVFLDPVTRTARVGARSARLTRREFAVLEALCANSGETLAPHDLLAAIWGQHAALPNLRVAIAGLRRKLETDPELPALIVTDPGAGYRLCPP